MTGMMIARVDEGEELMDQQQPRVWIVVRQGVGETAEELAAFSDETEAHAVVEALGEGHRVAVSLPLLSSGDGYRVVAWWQCRAVAAAGTVVEVGEPARMAGAARLLLPGEELEAQERARVDEGASELAAAVGSERVQYVHAVAMSAARARELAEEKARVLAEGQGHPA